MEPWVGPTSRVTTKAIKKGASLCYMTANLDKDYDDCDCKKEVGLLSKTQTRRLFHSPLRFETEKKNLEQEDE